MSAGITVECTPLEGVVIVTPERRSDARGHSCRMFSAELCGELGIAPFTEQWMYCPTERYTIYGIHFQYPPNMHAKLQGCIDGRGIDCAVDLRRDSPTFGQWFGCEISRENGRCLYTPRGFGHLFVSLEAGTRTLMLMDAPFAEASRGELRWDDPDIGLRLPIPTDAVPVLSERDRTAPSLRELLAQGRL